VAGPKNARAPSRVALKAELLGLLGRHLETLERAHRAACEGATHEEAKPENDKDTRAVEAAYLAGAQAGRARDLERASAALAALPLKGFGPGATIASSALVELEQEGAAHWYFLAPQGGGLRASAGGAEVQVITPQSPLGRELLGKAAGDDVEVTVQGKRRTYEILRVV
jgi:Transcription elongation factor, GreA/GreB, C-term